MIAGAGNPDESLIIHADMRSWPIIIREEDDDHPGEYTTRFGLLLPKNLALVIFADDLYGQENYLEIWPVRQIATTGEYGLCGKIERLFYIGSDTSKVLFDIRQLPYPDFIRKYPFVGVDHD